MIRYCNRPFPPYRHVPGRTPHPLRDEKGYAYGADRDDPEPFDPERWAESETYLFGIDLFNQRYWWAAHEAWEDCWTAAGRRSDSGQFLQGLIQIAAACLKREQGFNDAASRLAAEGMNRFPDDRRTMFGIDLEALRGTVTAHAISGDPAVPVIQLDPAPEMPAVPISRLSRTE